MLSFLQKLISSKNNTVISSKQDAVTAARFNIKESHDLNVVREEYERKKLLEKIILQ